MALHIDLNSIFASTAEYSRLKKGSSLAQSSEADPDAPLRHHRSCGAGSVVIGPGGFDADLQKFSEEGQQLVKQTLVRWMDT